MSPQLIHHNLILSFPLADLKQSCSDSLFSISQYNKITETVKQPHRINLIRFPRLNTPKTLSHFHSALPPLFHSNTTMGSAPSFPIGNCTKLDSTNTIKISSSHHTASSGSPHPKKSLKLYASFRLTYMSQARAEPPLTKKELHELVQVSQKNNARHSITGVLILCHDTFLQTLEGDKSHIMELIERIKRDRRNKELTVIRTEEAPKCEYCSSITTGSTTTSRSESCCGSISPNTTCSSPVSTSFKGMRGDSSMQNGSSTSSVGQPVFQKQQKAYQHPDGLLRQYASWSMKCINLNDKNVVMPTALMNMLHSVLDSHHMLSVHTQPTLMNLIGQGEDPRAIQPRMVRSVSLFCDVVQFSSLAEVLPPKKLYDMLNYYYEVVSESVETFGGNVSKLLGDGVYATWRTEGGQGCVKALRAARLAHRKLRDGRFTHPNLHSGFGISEGEVLEGSFGRSTLDFSQIGCSCNLSSRLESLTRDTSRAILFDESIYKHVRGEFSDISFHGEHQIKGYRELVNVYTVAGDEFILTRPELTSVDPPTEKIRKSAPLGKSENGIKSTRVLSM
mmetsp:Transcript_8305/g.30648  ORF Transcript_8305/g.30648 Transcript_8305/m.30648 type:complete len:563 (-) Transcript_8305:1923-3611(-)